MSNVKPVIRKSGRFNELTSVDILVDGLARNYPVVLNKSVTDVSHTGDTAEFKVYSVLIDANTFSAGQIIGVRATCRCVGVAAVKTFRIRFGTANNLTGTVCGTSVSLSSSLVLPIERRLVIKDATHFEVWASGTTTPEDNNVGTVAQTSVTVNLTVDNYLVFSVQNTNAADTSTFSWCMIELF